MRAPITSWRRTLHLLRWLQLQDDFCQNSTLSLAAKQNQTNRFSMYLDLQGKHSKVPELRVSYRCPLRPTLAGLLGELVFAGHTWQFPRKQPTVASKQTLFQTLRLEYLSTSGWFQG